MQITYSWCQGRSQPEARGGGGEAPFEK